MKPFLNPIGVENGGVGCTWWMHWGLGRREWNERMRENKRNDPDCRLWSSVQTRGEWRGVREEREKVNANEGKSEQTNEK